MAVYQNDKVMNVTALSPHIRAHKCVSTGGQFLTWSYDSSSVYWGNLFIFYFYILLVITQIIYLVWGPTMYQASVSHKDKDVKVDLKTYLKVYIQSVN